MHGTGTSTAAPPCLTPFSHFGSTTFGTHILYPFTAQATADWQPAQNATVGADVREEVNKTTLGLYSFHVLVDCAYSAKYIEKGQLPQAHACVEFWESEHTVGGNILIGCTPERKTGGAPWAGFEHVSNTAQTELKPAPCAHHSLFHLKFGHGGSYISLYGILIGRTPKEKLVVLRGPGSERVPNTPQMQLKPVPCAHRSLFHLKFGYGEYTVVNAMELSLNSLSVARHEAMWWLSIIRQIRNSPANSSHELSHLFPISIISFPAAFERCCLGANVSQLKIAMQSRGCAIECNGGVVCIIVAVAILLVYIEEPVAVSVYLVSADFPWALHL
ncbi:hypothetical protein B0H17DRAFT_1147947 [Mycena rosella]|uniref:Uncharacterized protein n=1 Tax=Mycena rosella TaxID=1033263 RepID=A0AAD7CHM8_MYCRO|nr:hypothetical protein B0H17DRAFT_1147947 [Mycena rosella]